MSPAVMHEMLRKLSHLDHTNNVDLYTEEHRGGGGYSDIFKTDLKEEILVPELKNYRCRNVAIKSFRFHVSTMEDFSKMIVREIRIWSKLRHKNILPLIGFVMRGQYPSLVSVWMENGTVVAYLKKFRDADIPQLAYGIASGLNFLHCRQIIHADLKSDNVLISPSGNPMLADFGLSRILLESGSVDRSTNIKGSMRWLAIELLEPSDINADTKPSLHTYATDIWALGMTIYEMLTLGVPYSHLRHDYQVMFSIIKYELPLDPPGLPQEQFEVRMLWWICRECWRKVPESRPNTVQLLSSLRALFSSRIDCDCDVESGLRDVICLECRNKHAPERGSDTYGHVHEGTNTANTPYPAWSPYEEELSAAMAPLCISDGSIPPYIMPPSPYAYPPNGSQGTYAPEVTNDDGYHQTYRAVTGQALPSYVEPWQSPNQWYQQQYAAYQYAPAYVPAMQSPADVTPQTRVTRLSHAAQVFVPGAGARKPPVKITDPSGLGIDFHKKNGTDGLTRWTEMPCASAAMRPCTVRIESEEEKRKREAAAPQDTPPQMEGDDWVWAGDPTIG